MSRLGASLLPCLIGAAFVAAPLWASASTPPEGARELSPEVSEAAPAAEVDSGTLTLFGRVICLPGATAIERCDLDLRPAQQAATQPEARPAEAAQRARVWEAFGLKFCLGGAVDDSCDVTFPPAPEATGGERRAKL